MDLVEKVFTYTSENDFNITCIKVASTWRSLDIFAEKGLEELLDKYYGKRWDMEKDCSWEHILN